MSAIWTVMIKDLRELARDRRTLALLFLVPVALYPGLMIASEQLILIGMRQIESGVVTVALEGEVPPAFRAVMAEIEGSQLVVGAGLDPESAVRSDSIAAVALFAPVDPATVTSEPQRRVTVIHNATNDRSRRGRELLEEGLQRWSDEILASRLSAEGLPPDFADPVVVSVDSIALPEEVGGWALGRFLPVILVMVTLLGTFHSAVDAGAGERERGTMEALLTAPVARGKIVLGKFAAVALVGIASAALNLGSLLITFRTGLVRFGGALDLELGISPFQALGIFVALIPLALLFGALFLGLSVRARSYREAQHALTPVYLAAFVPALLPMFSGIELNPILSLVPVGGVSLVLRDYLSGDGDLFLGVLAIGSTLVLTGLALRFAARSFGTEEVMFATDEHAGVTVAERSDGLSEGGTVSNESWRAARTMREPSHSGGSRVPPLSLALGFIGFIALAFFFVGIRLQVGLGEVGLLLSEWLLLGATAVAFVFGGRFAFRDTFSLARPRARQLVAGVLMATGGLAMAWVIAWIQSFFLPIPEEFLEATRDLLVVDGWGRLIWLVFLIAVTPAICEELVFRGVLLGASRKSLTAGRAIALNALLFGAFHLSFETVFRFLPTAWLGALLAVTVWKTRSIWVAMLMHFLNNGSIVVAGASPALRDTLSDPGSAPPAVVVAVGALSLALGLRLLFVGNPEASMQAVDGGGVESILPLEIE